MKTELWLGPSNNTLLPEILKIPVLTTIQGLNRVSTDKMINFIKISTGGKILIKAQKAPTFLAPQTQNTVQGKLSTDLFNCPMNHLKFGKWTLFSYPIFMDTNVLVICVFPLSQSLSMWINYYLFSA